MHREIKRVPLDFDWPMDTKWPGYLSPPVRGCPDRRCVNGSSTDSAWLHAILYPLLMLAEEVEGEPHRSPLHPWLREIPFIPKGRPSSRIREITTSLAGRESGFMGHDSLDHWSAVKNLAQRCGIVDLDEFLICGTCKGTATHPDDEHLNDAWEPTEPPSGDGWQLWESVTEGSPISPVFYTPEELARWCASNATIFADVRMSYQEWLDTIVTDQVDVASMLTGPANTLNR